MLLMQNLPIPTINYNPNIKDTLNIQAITIWTNKQKFIIQPNYQKSGIPTTLHINRQTQQILQKQILQKQKSFQQDQQRRDLTPHYFSLFLGILNLNGKKIIVLVEKVTIIMTISQRDIFKIIKPVYLFYKNQDKLKLSQEQSMILINLTLILEQGMYFSFSYNLDQPLYTDKINNNKQNINENKERNQKNSEYSLNFNWATKIQKQLQPFNKMWKVSLIQGYVDHIQMIINGLKIIIYLISRRSIQRSGTLYSSQGRGSDIFGFSSNCVQTQIIVNINEYYFSYVQLRGSVPLLWQEEYGYGGVNKYVKFKKGLKQNYKVFKKNLQKIKQRNNYKFIGLLNLLNQNVSGQKALVQNYQYLVKKNEHQNQSTELQSKEQQQYSLSQANSFLSNPEIFYAYFNIHSNCLRKDYHSLLSFVQQKLKPLIDLFEFTVIKIDTEHKKRQILNLQKGIIRVNCMNCIDRSNMAQMVIGGYIIKYMLKHIGIQIPEFQKGGLQFILKDEPFSQIYRELWANNADNLSKQYTGTGSTQSFALRKGKLSYLTTIDHGMKSLTRAFKNIRNPDQIKNKAIDLLTGYQALKQVKQTNFFSINQMSIIQLQQSKKQIQKRIQQKKLYKQYKDQSQ